MTVNLPLFLKPPTTVFVTGGSGFVGGRLIRTLIDAGFTVRALARSDNAAAKVRALGAEPVMGDLGDIPALTAGMTQCSAVFHSAANVEMWGPWEAFQSATVDGTRNVIAAARMAGVARLIHISTEAVLAGGKALIKVDERTPLPEQPNGFYPRSKGLAERAVLEANGQGLATVIVRPRLIWGLGDTSVMPQIIHAMRSKQWAWFGPDHQTSTSHITNVCHGTLLAARHGVGGEIYFLTDGDYVGFHEFISRLVETQGVTANGLHLPLWLADVGAAASEFVWRTLRLNGEPPLTRTVVNLFFREVTVSCDKARRELGYFPIMSIDQGMAELRDSFNQ